MTIHSQLTAAELHEPKDIATALAGRVYVADGAGGGAWTLQQAPTIVVPITEADMGTDMGSFIQMDDSTMYVINGTIAAPFIFTKELRYGVNTFIRGITPSLSVMKFTGSGNALNCLDNVFRADEITILGVSSTAGVAMNIDNSGGFNFIIVNNVIVDTFGKLCNATIGPGAADFANIQYIRGQDGWTFSGAANGVLRVSDTVFNITTGDLIDLGTATFDNITIDRIVGTPASGKAAVKGAAAGANITTGGIGKAINLDIDKSSGGLTFSGITTADTKWEMFDNNDEANSVWVGGMNKDTGRTTTTLITSTAVKIAGTSTLDTESERWDDNGGADNRLKYIDVVPHKAFITGSVIGQSSGGSTFTCDIIARKNGTTDIVLISGVVFPTGADSSFSFHKPIAAIKDDFFELFIKRTSGATDLDCAVFSLDVIRVD